MKQAVPGDTHFPAETESTSLPLKRIVFLLLLTGILAAGFFYYFRILQKENEIGTDKIMELRKVLLEKEDQSVIEELEKILLTVNDPAIKAELTRGLGVAYFYLDKNSEHGSAVLKEAILNQSYPAINRARAMTTLLALTQISGSDEDAKKYVFSRGEPWESFLRGEDMAEAVRRGYEYADNISPSSRSKYNIGLWHGNKLLADSFHTSPKMSTEKKNEHRRKLAELLKSGDELLEYEISYLATLPTDFAHTLFAQGRLYAIQYILEGDPKFKQQSEVSYKQAHAMVEKEVAIVRRVVLVFINLHYASFLSWLTENKEENRTADVKELITPLLEDTPNNQDLFPFLKNFQKYGDGPTKTLIAGIGETDSRFRDLLTKQGWPIK